MPYPRTRWHQKTLLAAICLFAFLTLSPEPGLGESISVPLANNCPPSDVQAGSRLTAGLGGNQTETITVDYGEGTTLSGWLSEGDRGVGGAWICIYSKVTTENEAELLGRVVTDQNGRYEIALPPGPSRTLTALYKNGQGQIDAWALLQGRTAPTLRLQNSVVHNKHFAYFNGEIPGPDNDGVLVFLQVKDGKGWRVFRRYVTREGGKFSMRYHFTRTFTPTTFIVRAQVLGAPGYPYLGGNSQERALHVLP
jgi:hypothetical protein